MLGEGCRVQDVGCRLNLLRVVKNLLSIYYRLGSRYRKKVSAERILSTLNHVHIKFIVNSAMPHSELCHTPEQIDGHFCYNP